MDNFVVSCLLLLLANVLAPAECQSPTQTSTEAPCKKDGSEGQHCYRTALCETCSQTEVRCYDTDLPALKSRNFEDAFCGHHGVVLVQKRIARLESLIPLECSNGICPDQSECRKNPKDGVPYCCSLEKLVNSRCFVLDVAGRSKEVVTRKITDENGNPVNISKVTIVLANSDVKCLQGWSYSFKDDTVYMSNQCPVRFEVCYQLGPPTSILPNRTDLTIVCQPLSIRCGKKQQKTKTILDEKKKPVNITSVTIVKQLTKVICEEGKNFFFKGSKITVKNGCAAKFEICYPRIVSEVSTHSPSAKRFRDAPPPSPSARSFRDAPPPSPSTRSLRDTPPPSPSTRSPLDSPPIQSELGACVIVELFSTPESIAERTSVDAEGSPLKVTSMVLQERYSQAKCLPGVTYSFTGSAVQASGGCKATFKVCYEDRKLTTPTTPVTAETGACVSVELSSTSESPAQKKSVDVQGLPLQVRSMVVESEHSNDKCQTGRTYNFSADLIWASDGCMASFKVCYEGSLMTLMIAERGSCRIIQLTSFHESLAEKRSIDAEGSPLKVRSMDIYREHSDGTCLPGETYSFNGTVIQATGGCMASFNVCYEYPILPTNPPTVVTVSQQVITPETTVDASQIGCEDVEFPNDTVTEKSFEDDQGQPLVVISLHEINVSPNCRLGETYAFSYSEVRVTGGCGGTFRVCYLRNTNPQVATTPTVPVNEPVCTYVTLRGSGTDRSVQTFISNSHSVEIVSMQLVKPLSFVQCNEWVNYYFEGDSVLSKGGCWGEFEVCYLENVTLLSEITTEREGQTCRFISLSSIQNRRAGRTITDLQGENVALRSVQLARQLSDAPCVPQKTFGYDGSYIEARSGCIGIFQICYDAGDVNFTAPDGETCDRKVAMFSYISDPDKYKLTVNDRPVTVRAMILVEQISEVACVLGDNYFFVGSILHARDGCKGVFRICYVAKGDQTVATTIETPVTTTPVTTTLVTTAPVTTTPVTTAPVTTAPVFTTPVTTTPVTTAPVTTTPVTTTPLTTTPVTTTPVTTTPLTTTTVTTAPVTTAPGTTTPVTTTQLTTAPITTTPVTTTPVTTTPVTTTPVTTAPLTTTPNVPTDESNERCENVKLVSSLKLPVKKTFIDSEGNPLLIVSVKLVEQISQLKCAKGDTVIVEPYALWVTTGCKAVFQVCVKSASEETTTPATTPTESDQKCETVKLMSTLKLPVKKTFIDSEGNPLPIVSVKLVEQTSQTKCVEGHTFTVYQYALRVIGGCKAVFQVCVESAPQETTTPATTTEADKKCQNVKLMSRPNLPVKKTFIDSEGNQLPIVSVKLVEQISQTKCTEGLTFSVYEYALRVTGGCKAVFQVCIDAAVEEMTTPATQKGDECMKMEMDSSKSNRLKLIRVVDRKSRRPVRITSVDVDKQMTDIPCELGETFEYEDNSVRVTGGCGAVFKVCYEKEIKSRPKEDCTNVTLHSSLEKAKAANIKDKKGNPVQIVSAKVLTQLSHIRCILRETYNYKDGMVWASGGCSAVLKICYVKKSHQTSHQ